MTLTLKQVQAGIEAGIKKAQDLKSPSSISVVDAGRNLVGFVRMDNALLASIEISQGKAYTSRSLNMKTGDIMSLVQPGGPLYGLESSHVRPLVVFAGGVPILIGGDVVGAVGVAGGAPNDDEAIAAACANAIAASK